MHKIVFMVDFDNTICDNDGVKADIKARMLEILGPKLAARFWELYEEVRKDVDIIDFFETMRRLRAEFAPQADAVDAATHELMNWDFGPRMYPRALETMAHFAKIGLPVVVSDGDAVYQPSKIHQAGVTAAVDGRVFIFVHKEKYLPNVEMKFKAQHYVLIDDKPGILMRSKALLGDRLTTVQVLQGKYALDPKLAVDYTPDIVVQEFGDLLAYDADAFQLRPKAGAIRR